MKGLIDPDLLFPGEERGLSADVDARPIVSPNGHTDLRRHALNAPFPGPAQRLIVPDHGVFHMLFSQGVKLEDGIRGVSVDPRAPRYCAPDGWAAHRATPQGGA